jgi:hypothetical protein
VATHYLKTFAIAFGTTMLVMAICQRVAFLKKIVDPD